MSDIVNIQRRFCGPPDSGNGGYVCGLVGEAIEGAATVRLFLPPPLEKRLVLNPSDEKMQLLDGDKKIAEGWGDTVDIVCPPAPSFEHAVTAAKQCSGFHEHPFPCCFVCGPDRKEGDGLRIFPGHLPGSDVVAAPWVPDKSLRSEGNNIDRVFIWAALDCTSAFPMLPVGEGKALVLGQMTVQINTDVQIDEEYVMLGWPVAQDGKKYLSGSSVMRADGSVAAIAKATWIEVPAADFQ